VLLTFLRLPFMAAKVEPQMSQAKRDIERKLIPSGPHVTRYLSLPAEGQTKEWILGEMSRMDEYCHESDAHGKYLVDWKDGKLSGAVYREQSSFLLQNRAHLFSDGGQDVTSLIVAAFERYCVSNPLHPDVFPTIRKMEAEIVAMCLR
jgi:sphinganine-1-phosphate aldolase